MRLNPITTYSLNVQPQKNLKKTQYTQCSLQKNLMFSSYPSSFKGKRPATEAEYLDIYNYIKNRASVYYERDVMIKRIIQFDIHKPIQYAEGQTDTFANMIKTKIKEIIAKNANCSPFFPFKLHVFIPSQYTPKDVYELASDLDEQNAMEIVEFTINDCGKNFIEALQKNENPAINYFFAKNIIKIENSSFPVIGRPNFLSLMNLPLKYGKEFLELAEQGGDPRVYKNVAQNLERMANRDLINNAKSLYEENGGFSIDEIDRFVDYKNFNKIMTEPLNDIGENIAHFLPEIFVEEGSENYNKLRNIFEKIQDAKFDFSKKDSLDRTPLMKAIEAENVEVAKLLLEFGKVKESDLNEIKILALNSDNQELKKLFENF